jgi:DNA repair exonuclease SbcCD ATPase subunit
MQNADDSPSGPDDRDGPGVDPTDATFEDWIDHVADTEGVPPEAVRARLMSSYWILDELARHLDDVSLEDLSDELAAKELTGTGSGEDNNRIRAMLEELVADARSMEPHRRADPERLVEVVESLDGFGETGTHSRTRTASPESEHAADPLKPARRKLREQVEAAREGQTASRHERSTPGEEPDRHLEEPIDSAELEAMEAEMTDRLSELEAMLEAVEAEVDRLDSVLSEQTEDLTDIDGRLDAQTDRLGNLGDTLATLAEKLQALDGSVETNLDRLDQFESTIDDHANHFQELQHSVSEHESELDKATEVLRSLFSEVDDLDDRTAVIASVLRDLEPVVSAHHERGQVDSLKEAAAELGVRTAECETCERTVNLGLLTEPACPHCGTPAAEVDSRSGLLWSKSVLESGERAEQLEGPAWDSALAELDFDRSPE